MASQIGLLDGVRLSALHTIGNLERLELDVGFDALGLDGAAVRRVVAGGGQLDRSAVAQRQNGLHRPLAEGALAKNQCAVMVLQRAGDDFRG